MRTPEAGPTLRLRPERLHGMRSTMPRRAVIVSVLVCACGSLADAPSSTLPRDGADASTDGDAGIDPRAGEPPYPGTCRPWPDTAEAIPIAPVPAGVVADFAVRGRYASTAIAPNGDAALAWQADAPLHTRLFRGSNWLDVETIVTAGRHGDLGDRASKVAMRPDGSLFVAYDLPSKARRIVCAREREQTGVWSSPSTLTETGIGWWQEPQWPAFELASDRSGNVTALVRVLSDPPDLPTTGLLAFRVDARSHHFDGPHVLTTDPPDRMPLAVTDGEAFAVWARGWSDSRAQAAAFTEEAGWKDALPPSLGAYVLSATAERDGSVSVLGARRVDEMYRIETARRRPDGTWAAPFELGAVSDLSSAQLVAGDTGQAFATWTTWSRDCTLTANIVRRDTSGTWSSETIPGAPANAKVIDAIALSESGHALIAWRPLDRDGKSCHAGASHLSWLSPSGVWSPPVPLSSGTLVGPPLLTSAGRALVAWHYDDLVLVRWIDPP